MSLAPLTQSPNVSPRSVHTRRPGRRLIVLMYMPAYQLNAYMTLKEPWKLKEQEQSREAAGVFSLLLEGLRKSSILLQPIIPESSQKLLNGLGYAEKPTWKAAQSDHTIDGMRNILDAVMRNGRGNHIFPALTRPEVTTDI